MAGTVLVVDDAASMRQLVTYVLQDAGYEVMAAENGIDALGKLKGTTMGLVVTDLNMPGMDGIELIKELRGTDANRFTPVVMLTTESQASRIQEGKKAGASGWIVKPFSPEHLVEVVKKFMR